MSVVSATTVLLDDEAGPERPGEKRREREA
jgi:hypothetical protein